MDYTEVSYIRMMDSFITLTAYYLTPRVMDRLTAKTQKETRNTKPLETE